MLSHPIMSPSIRHTHAFRAMNCQMTAWVYADNPAAQAALLAVEHWMRRVERELSRFRPDSDLSRLNAAAGRPYPAGALLWEVTQQALALAEATDGVFDPTVGRAMIAAGYDRSFERLAAAADAPLFTPTLSQPRHAWRDVQMDSERRTITLPAVVQLDLGGIAKGWAADRALAILRPFGPALVDAGGDLAIGAPPPDEEGWPVTIADPLSPESDLAFLSLANVGFATSGTDHRRWRHGGQQQHHLIDPRSSRPACTDILTATVIAATATEADVLALTLIIMGLDATDAWLQRHPLTPALLALNDGRTYQNQTFAKHTPAFFPTYATN